MHRYISLILRMTISYLEVFFCLQRNSIYYKFDVCQNFARKFVSVLSYHNYAFMQHIIANFL